MFLFIHRFVRHQHVDGYTLGPTACGKVVPPNCVSCRHKDSRHRRIPWKHVMLHIKYLQKMCVFIPAVLRPVFAESCLLKLSYTHDSDKRQIKPEEGMWMDGVVLCCFGIIHRKHENIWCAALQRLAEMTTIYRLMNLRNMLSNGEMQMDGIRVGDPIWGPTHQSLLSCRSSWSL